MQLAAGRFDACLGQSDELIGVGVPPVTMSAVCGGSQRPLSPVCSSIPCACVAFGHTKSRTRSLVLPCARHGVSSKAEHCCTWLVTVIGQEQEAARGQKHADSLESAWEKPPWQLGHGSATCHSTQLGLSRVHPRQTSISLHAAGKGLPQCREQGTLVANISRI